MEPPFIPAPADPTDTTYFDGREGCPVLGDCFGVGCAAFSYRVVWCSCGDGAATRQRGDDLVLTSELEAPVSPVERRRVSLQEFDL